MNTTFSSWSPTIDIKLNYSGDNYLLYKNKEASQK